MTPIPLREVFSDFYVYGPGGNSVGVSTAMIEKLACSPVVVGDRKSPNNFFFRLHRQYGGPYRFQTTGVYQTKPYIEGSYSDFRIWDVDFRWDTDPLDVDWPRTDDRSLEKVFDQIRGDSNLAVDFLEGGSTIKMIRNLANVKKEFIKTVTRSSGKRSKRYKGPTDSQKHLDYLTSKWLEARYGWLPLVYSTYDLLKTLGRRLQGGIIPVKGRSGVTIEDVTTYGSYASVTSPLVKRTRKLSYRTELFVRLKLPEGNQLYDFTSLNPAGIAWELMPLSFVADWFVNVGEVLSLWENYFIYANRFAGGYRTRSYSEEITTTVNGSVSNVLPVAPNGDTYDGIASAGVSAGDRVFRKYLSREVLTSLPLPSQGLRFKPELNAKRLLDAAALFHVFTKKR